MDPKMEAVHNFTNELFSLYDFKIPISKAKMGSITKTAMKAIKFYKHVVQNVEKFILKCKPEYKIPGLYVIDSIVRQSRHQFGPEKDVFAPRFARNMEETFAHLFRCSQEDKSKIIRVLNLWQKNNVFAPEVIQPLFDLANPDHPVHQAFMQQQQQNVAGDAGNGHNLPRDSPQKEEAGGGETLSALNIQKFQYQQMMLQQQTTMDQMDAVKFNNQLLDYDYGSDGEEAKGEGGQTSHQQQMQPVLQFPFNNFTKCLEDPNIIKQLQNIKQMDMQRYLSEMPGASNSMMDPQQSQSSGIKLANINNLRNLPIMVDKQDQDVELVGDIMSAEIIPVSSRSPTPNRHKRRKSRSRSRDKNRYGRRRRSRSKSRSRSYSRSPRNRRRSSRDRVKEKEREVEKERRRKGLPDIKKDHLSVCSTTLWVGHLSKLVQQEELSDTFGKYGDIISIDMIPPRGCAYIVMNRRQDAYKAMHSLKNYKMQNRAITISWAAGKGVKSKEWKDYFDQTLGVTYIPSVKLTHATDFEALEEGGMYDEDTIPVWVKEKLKQPQNQAAIVNENIMIPQFFAQPIDTSQPPPNPSLLPTMPPFALGARPMLMPGQGLMPLGIPPPNMLMQGMVFPTGHELKQLPPGLLGFPPLAAAAAAAANAQQSLNSNQGDDHMDIEMEDDVNTANQTMQQAFFNQPPPMSMNMAALMMGANQTAALQNSQNSSVDQHQNDSPPDFKNRLGSRGNRSQSREKDNRHDFRQRAPRDRRSAPGEFNNRNSRWPNNSNGRERMDERSRDGPMQNNFNRRSGQDMPLGIPSLLSQPMPLLDNDDAIPSRNRNNDFGRDEFDRRQGFSNRGGFQPRGGQRGRGQFNRGGMRGFQNNDFDSGPNQRNRRGGSRNWRDDDSERRNFSQRGPGNFERKESRWMGNPRNSESHENEEQSEQKDSPENSKCEEIPRDNAGDGESNNCEQHQSRSEDAPPGTEEPGRFDEQHEQHEVPTNDDISTNQQTFNHDESAADKTGGDNENTGNTTPLCDEAESKE